MPSLKQKAGTLILLIVVYLWYFVGHLPNFTQNNVNVLGAETNVSLFTQPEEGKAPILEEIKNAKHEIMVEMYLLSDKDIISTLCQARERGLSVNVMLEEHPFGGGNLNPNAKENLKDCDVSVNWSNPSFSLTHEKAIIIDGSKVFILNQNLTASSFSKNREYDVFDTNQQDVTYVRSIFINDWLRKPFTPSSSNLVVSPYNSRPEIVRLINSATNNIDIEMEVIDDNQIVSLLLEKAKTEEVRIIVPTLTQINTNKKTLNKLKDAGVFIKTLSNPYIHAKMISVDNKKAYVGSVNLSSQSMDKNREVGIIISKQDILQTINSIFEKDWEKASNFNAN